MQSNPVDQNAEPSVPFPARCLGILLGSGGVTEEFNRGAVGSTV